MARRAIIVAMVLMACGCSVAKTEQVARWLANCSACSWRTTGLVKDGVAWKDGDRCPKAECRGRLAVSVMGDGSASAVPTADAAPEKPAFGLERYSR
ncbi:MAG: hypothetical protein ACKO4T_15450 [Planctomycetaceae bacterium]